MSYKLHKLAESGLNVQGVPMGLVNWMCLNRSKTAPLGLDRTDITLIPVCDASRISSGFVSPVLWADLALSRPRTFGNRGFLTINLYNWRRH